MLERMFSPRALTGRAVVAVMGRSSATRISNMMKTPPHPTTTTTWYIKNKVPTPVPGSVRRCSSLSVVLKRRMHSLPRQTAQQQRLLTAVTGQDSFFVRDGDEAALPCKNARHDQDKCGSTYWTFSHSMDSAVDLVVQGQIGKDAQTKSDRLSLTENCSLVLKNVSREDFGLYSCRQINPSGEREAPDALVLLSVVTITEQKDGDEVTLTCFVWMYIDCRQSVSVKWQFIGTDVDKYNKDLRTSQNRCSATASFSTSHFIHTSKKYESLKCEVTSHSSKKKQQFTFRSQSSGKNRKTPGNDGKTTVIVVPNGNGTTHQAATDCSALTFVMLLVRVAGLLLIAVVAVLLVRARGNQRAPECNTVSDSVRSTTVMRSGAAASQVNNDDEDDGAVNYENSVTLH